MTLKRVYIVFLLTKSEAELPSKYSEGWPIWNGVQADPMNYWPSEFEIALEDSILRRASQIIVQRSKHLQRLREGHQGITK